MTGLTLPNKKNNNPGLHMSHDEHGTIKVPGIILSSKAITNHRHIIWAWLWEGTWPNKNRISLYENGIEVRRLDRVDFKTASAVMRRSWEGTNQRSLALWDNLFHRLKEVNQH